MPAKPRSRGRPSKYSDKLAKEICKRIADGESLDSICRDDHMPPGSRVRAWLTGAVKSVPPQFRDEYERARVIQADVYFDQILDISDAPELPNSPGVKQRRLMIDARKWVLARMNRAKYGERTDVGLGATPDAEPVQANVSLASMDEDDLRALRELARKALQTQEPA